MRNNLASIKDALAALEAADRVAPPTVTDDLGGFRVLTLDLSATTAIKELPPCRGVLYLNRGSAATGTITFRSGGQTATLYPGDVIRGNYARAQLVAASGSGSATVVLLLDDKTNFESGLVNVQVTGGVSGTSTAYSVSAVNVQTTGSLLNDGLTDRRALFVQNLGPNPIYIGDASVATTTGIEVPANGGTVTLPIQVGTAIYAIAATANQTSPLNTRIMATN